MSSGFNPMLWDCEQSGCFNKKRRPKIEAFYDCFPGRINFGDVDGLVEINGRFCMLEWKGTGGHIKTGQRITYEQFTRCVGNIVIVVNGNAETMEIVDYGVFWEGKYQGPQPATLDELKRRVSDWVDWVYSQGAITYDRPV